MLLYLILVVVAIPVLGVVYVVFNKESIKQQLLNQLNQSLHTKITIEKIGIDFYHNFPKVSLDLEQVKVADAFKRDIHLLDAQHIYVGFNIIDIFNKNYRIRKINIDSGSVHVFVTKKGKANYDILASDSASESADFFLHLQQIELNNIRIFYDDRSMEQLYSGLVHHISGGFAIDNHTTSVDVKGDLFAEKVKSGKLTLIKDKELSLKGGFAYNTSLKEFTLQTSNISIDALHLVLTGKINNQEKQTGIDLTFNAREANIQALLAILPFKSSLADQWKSNGDVYFAGTIKGIYNDRQTPAVNVSFGVKDGKLKQTERNVELEEINCKGTLTYVNGNGVLKINPLKCKLNESVFSGDLELSNFSNPYIKTSLTCHLEANDLIKLSGVEFIKDADGSIDAQLSLRGRLDDVKNNISQVTSSGEIKVNLEDVSFRDIKEDIELLKADLSVNGGDFKINSLQSTFEKSDINISGSLLHVFGYLFSKQQLVADIRYQSSYIDLNHFMLPSGIAEEKQSTPFALPERIALNAHAAIDEFVYNKFRAEKVSADILWIDNHVDFKNIQAKAVNGQINGECQVNAATDGRFLLSAKGKLGNVNITELFRQCNNFSQEELTHENLKGELSADIDLTSVWSNTWECDMDKLYVTSQININNGEINNYTPLQKLSRFANIDDLKNLRFASLKNNIDIRGKVITIPEMDVMNNALNLTVSGTHTFLNELDYKLKIKLSELLKKKRKPVDNEFGEEEDSGRGMYLYLTMKGPANNLKITYDKMGVKNKIKQDLKKEKENIKDVLKKELGIGKDTTIREKKTDSDELEFEPE